MCIDNQTRLQKLLSDNLYNDIIRTTNESIFSIPQKCENKRFLITGANGFIAYYLVLTILNANDMFYSNNHVVLLVRNQEKAYKRYGDILKRKDVTLAIQDVCTSLLNIGKVDYVIHAASSADAYHFEMNPIDVFNANVLGTENVIEFINATDCKSAVYISSFAVYGQGTEEISKVNEEFCGKELWNTNKACYSYGKRSAEFICMAAARQYACPIKIVRPGFVNGASSKNDMRVYAEIIRCVANNVPILLRSSGLAYRSMIYVTDLVTAILSVLLNGKNGEPYNVANEHVSIRKFAETAVSVAASKDVWLEFQNEQDKNVNIPDVLLGAMSTEKIYRECGWKAQVKLNAGIQTAVRIFRDI